MSRIKRSESIKIRQTNGKLLDYQYYEYNYAGQIEYCTEYSERGRRLFEKKLEYQGGLLVKESEINESEHVIITESAYDEQKELIKETKTYEDGSFERRERVIEPFLETTTHFDTDGEEINRQVVYKDQQGYPIKYEEYMAGELVYYNEIKNDSYGKLLEKTTVYLNSDEEKRDTVKIDYDSNGNEIQVDRYNELGEWLDSELSTYERNLLVFFKYENHYDSHYNHNIEYKYDRDENLLEETKRNYKGDIIYCHKFEYNKYGDKIAYTEIEVDVNRNSLQKFVFEIEYW